MTGRRWANAPAAAGLSPSASRDFSAKTLAAGLPFGKTASFFTAKKKNLTKSVAASLLKDGRVKLTGCYSEKTGKTYDATVVMEDTGEKTNFKLVFGNG